MKFLIVTQYYPPEIGGPQTRLSAFASELRAAGHEVEVVTALPNYPRGRFFEEFDAKLYQRQDVDGAPIHRVWMYPAMGGGVKRLLSYLSFSATSALGLLRASRSDYVFVESPPLFLAVPAILFSRARGSRVVMNVSDLWPDAIAQGGFMSRGLAYRCLERLEAWCYRNSDFVNAVTEGIRDSIVQDKRVPDSKVLFLPNGVNTQLFRPLPNDAELRSKLDISANKKIFLWAGTLGFAHGLNNLLRAAQTLLSCDQIHFLFVGDGSAKAQLEATAQTLGLQNVTFVPPVPATHLPAYFSIATAGLASLLDIPLHQGARPSKMFPVLASAKPVVFVGSGEGARLIERAHAGFVVPAGDPDALAATILKLASDEGLVEMLGANGRAYVQNHFEWSALVSTWLEQLQLKAIQPPLVAHAVKAS